MALRSPTVKGSELKKGRRGSASPPPPGLFPSASLSEDADRIFVISYYLQDQGLQQSSGASYYNF